MSRSLWVTCVARFDAAYHKGQWEMFASVNDVGAVRFQRQNSAPFDDETDGVELTSAIEHAIRIITTQNARVDARLCVTFTISQISHH